jgi:hypothetical protein
VRLLEYEYLHDSYDCETCGASYAEGIRIRVDGEVKAELTPVAHCLGGSDYGLKHTIKAVLEVMGIMDVNVCEYYGDEEVADDDDDFIDEEAE